MHNLGVVHKDIKKENILMVGGAYVLADFGVSEEINDYKNCLVPDTDTFKIVQNLGGSPLYMPPVFKDAFLRK